MAMNYTLHKYQEIAIFLLKKSEKIHINRPFLPEWEMRRNDLIPSASPWPA
jgi:hypothetical protein